MKREWADFSCAPLTQQCYQQERTAMAHSMTTGMFGGDHWYARNWILAVFKLLTLGGMSIWAIVDVFLWIDGCFYSTSGCDGSSNSTSY